MQVIYFVRLLGILEVVGGGVYYSSINLHAKKEGIKSPRSPLLLQFKTLYF